MGNPLDAPLDDATIIDTLDKSGFFLEERVVNTLMQHNFNVKQSFYYTDPDEGILREMDIVASRWLATPDGTSVPIEMHLVIECKNKRGPLVAFLKDRSVYEMDAEPFEFQEYRQKGSGIRSGLWGNCSLQQIWRTQRLGVVPKASQVVRISPRSNKSNPVTYNADSEVRDLGFPPMKAAWTGVRSEGRSRTNLLVFAACVTSSQLYGVDTGDILGGQPRLHSQPFVTVAYDTQARWGQSGASNYFDIVQYGELDQWLTALDSLSEMIAVGVANTVNPTTPHDRPSAIQYLDAQDFGPEPRWPFDR